KINLSKMSIRTILTKYSQMHWEETWSDQRKFQHACRYRWDAEIYKLAPKADEIGQGILRIIEYDRDGISRKIDTYVKADLDLIEKLAKMLPPNWVESLYMVLKIFVANDDCKRLQRFIKYILEHDTQFGKTSKTDYFQRL